MASASVQGHSSAVLGERRGRRRNRTCSLAMPMPPVRRGVCVAPRELGSPTPCSRPITRSHAVRTDSVPEHRKQEAVEDSGAVLKAQVTDVVSKAQQSTGGRTSASNGGLLYAHMGTPA